MKHTPLMFWSALGLGAASLLSYLPLTAQDPARSKTAPPGGNSEIRIADRQSVPTNMAQAGALAQSAWIRFEKCLVFAPDSVEISAQDTGVLASLVLREGMVVQSGDNIGAMDTESAELEKQLAGLQLQVANSEATDLSDLRLAEMLVEETQLQLDNTIELNNKSGASDVDVRQKRISLEQAKARVIQAKTIKTQREVKAKIAQASYLVSEKRLNKLRLTAPVSGMVSRVDHFPGEWVTAGTPLLKIIRMDEMQVDFFVDMALYDPASLVNRRAMVRWQGKEKVTEFVGKISGFAPDISQSGMIRMHATVQNQKIGDFWTLLPGMTVEVLVSNEVP